MQNTWFKNLEKNKIINFLKNYFKENNIDVLVNINFFHNKLGQYFIEVETLDKDEDYLKTRVILGEYFVLNPDCNLDFFNNNNILDGIENYQSLNKNWINFIYENTKNIKIDGKTYKEFLYSKLEKNLLCFYENNMAFVINNYLKNENGFTENATIATIKEFKKEYDKELKNLPNLINALIGENQEENIK